MSVNIQGLKHNSTFISEICNDYDVILIQEHWLPRYDMPAVGALLKNFSMLHSTAQDDDETETEFCRRPACLGGLATVWNKKLSPYIDPSKKEGNSRILLTRVNLPSNPMCIINCYLPSGNSKAAKELFFEDLDTLHELIETYSSSHDILIMGDLNMDHFHRSGPKETAFIKLMEEHKLKDLGIPVKSEMTYENCHLNHKSHIDHAFLKLTHPTTSWSDYHVRTKDNYLNTSYHHPIALEVRLPWRHETRSRTQKAKKVKIFDLKKIDVSEFQRAMDDELEDVRIESLDADSAIHVLQCAMNTATLCSTTFKTVKTQASCKKNPVWSTELAEAVRASKIAHHEWKAAGRPEGTDPLWQARKVAKKNVRRTQRRQTARDRSALLDEIEAASEKDSKLFHKLVRKQRQKVNPSYCLMVDGRLVQDPDEQRDAMAEHFKALSNPEKNKEVPCVTHYLRSLYGLLDHKVSVTPDAVDAAIRELASGKAKDMNGHAAEQIHIFTPKAKALLHHALQEIGEKKSVPARMKTAYKIPIPKNGKDSRLLDNFRGITIAPIFQKTLEIVTANTELRHKIDQASNNLQVGFTRGLTPSMASLYITEAAAHARLHKTPLFIATLDARKAFDVVNHDILKKKLFQLDISGGMWGIIDSLYSDSKECIRWKGEDSAHFDTKQGVKQGSIISPMLYKAYINDLLNTLQRNQMGALIGDQFIGSPTCADDVLLISFNQHELQAMLNVCQEYSNLHGYEIHPGKSSVTILYQPRGEQETSRDWILGDAAVTKDDRFTHLGIEWRKGKTTPDVLVNISKARRAAYALLRTGLHGCDGLGPTASLKLISLYVTPCLLHGLEAAVLDRNSINLLDVFFRKLLRQVQTLPESTATEAVYWLAGVLPIEAQYHRKILTLAGSICRLPRTHQLHKLATRQLAIRDNRNSWFLQADKIGEQYGLDLQQQLDFPWTKLAWKSSVKSRISSHWHIQLFSSSIKKTSLQWLITDDSPPVGPHRVWKFCNASEALRTAAFTRARLISGKFRTAASEAKYSRGTKSPKCQICDQEEEDVQHLLVNCPGNKHDLGYICRFYIEEGKKAPSTPGELCSAILNGDKFKSEEDVPGIISLEDPTNISRANQGCSFICHRIVKNRDTLLTQLLN